MLSSTRGRKYVAQIEGEEVLIFSSSLMLHTFKIRFWGFRFYDPVIGIHMPIFKQWLGLIALVNRTRWKNLNILCPIQFCQRPDIHVLYIDQIVDAGRLYR